MGDISFISELSYATLSRPVVPGPKPVVLVRKGNYNSCKASLPEREQQYAPSVGSPAPEVGRRLLMQLEMSRAKVGSGTSTLENVGSAGKELGADRLRLVGLC